MLISIVISGLLLTLHANCQQSENTFVTDNANQPSDDPVLSIRSNSSPTQNGNDAGFLRKDSRNSDIFTVSRNDGRRTTFRTYEHKGFFAQTGFNKSQSTGNQFEITRRPYHSIGGKPVPGVSTNNKLMELYPRVPTAAFPAIGGKPVGLRVVYNNIKTPNSRSRPRAWHQSAESDQKVSSSPIYVVDRYSPYSYPRYRNNSKPSSSYFAADPSIGGHPVHLIHPNFENPILNQKLLLSSRTGVPRPSDSKEVTGETKRLGWQVSVFSKEVTPYVRVCGGSIVTSTAVISAAQCFWGVGMLLAEHFAVGAEALTNPNTTADDYDSYLQKIDVRDIKIPPEFQGLPSNQADIAVLLLERPFYFHLSLQPACVLFDYALDEKQLVEGSQGMILGTGSTSTKSPVLLNHRVAVISIDQCFKKAAEENLRLFTRDKICAGVQSTPPNARICNHDIGSGLAFFLGRNLVPLLRGVASSPLYASACSAYGLNTYTRLQSHMAFLLQHVPNVDKVCWDHYPHIATILEDTASQADLDDNDEVEVDREEYEEDDDEQFVCNCYC